jgi:hypothetical protein
MKMWKILQIVGVLILLVGVVVRVGGEFYGVHLALLGLLLWIVGKVGAWLKSDQA